ncbi:MAG: hypothetical protein AAGB46_15375 [Verrucomicrobiota bacterium]
MRGSSVRIQEGGGVYLGAYEVFSLIALLALSLANIASIEYAAEWSEQREEPVENPTIPLNVVMSEESESQGEGNGFPEPYVATHRLLRIDQPEGEAPAGLVVIEVDEDLDPRTEFRLRINSNKETHEIAIP